MSQDDSVPPPPQDPPAASPPPPPAASASPPVSPPPPPAGGASGSATGDSSNRTVMLVLSYLFLLALIPLLMDKDEDVQWHAKHGLLLTVAWFVIALALFSVSMVVDWCLFGCATSLLGLALWVVAMGVHIFAIVKALNGERLHVPVVTDLVAKI